MGLSYHYTFSAPATVSAEELTVFLRSVEGEAQKMGFHPTMVLNAAFDTPERRQFARGVVKGVHVEDERLKGVVMPAQEQVWDFSPGLGHCRLAPERAVILVVTDERGSETVFGFARYPDTLRDINGRELMESPVGNRWFFRESVDSPDPRFRKIVKRFAAAGYLDWEKDEFVGGVRAAGRLRWAQAAAGLDQMFFRASSFSIIWRSFRRAIFWIWRTRSRVTPNLAPTSSSVSSLPPSRPKRSRRMVFSRESSVLTISRSILVTVLSSRCS
jgi:hypothetical protein